MRLRTMDDETRDEIVAACEVAPRRTINTIEDLRELLTWFPDNAPICVAAFGHGEVVFAEWDGGSIVFAGYIHS
jgi:hypothetical protein